MTATPPAYSQTPGLSLAPNTAQNPQNHGYKQQQDPDMGQGYSLGQQSNYKNPGCPQIIYARPCQQVSPTYDNFKSRQSVVLGICKIIIGILCIAFNAAFIAISHFDNFSFIVHGIWGGVMIILAGTFGVAGGKIKSKCLIISYMVMCIIAALVAAVIMSLQIMDLVIAIVEYNGYGWTNYPIEIDDDLGDTRLAMAILLIALPGIAAGLCIWGSSLCCMVSCCSCCSCCCSRCTASQLTLVDHQDQKQQDQLVQCNVNPQSLFVIQANSTPQGVPYPGYPIQVVVNTTRYQPLVHCRIDPINEGIPSKPAEKRPID